MLSYVLLVYMKKSVVVLLIVLVQIFCSLFRSKVSPYPSGIMFPLETEAELSYEGEIINRIQRRGHKLFLSTRKGKVYCIDGRKRRIRWEYSASEPLASFPYLGLNGVFIFDEQNRLYCLDQEGRIQWRKIVPGKITSHIGCEEDQIYIGNDKGSLICLNPRNGEVRWAFQADGPIRSNPVVWNNQVIFSCDDHHIYSLNRSGSLIWKHHTGAPTGGTLRVDEDSLYFGTADHRLHGLGLNRRKPEWSIRTGGATYIPPVVEGKRIFFLCWNCVLYCLNKKTGTILWWNSVPSRSYYRIEIIEDKVVAASLSPQLVCFDVKTGKERGSYEASREIQSNPLWFPPYLLVNFYDRSSDTGTLAFLRKEVSAVLSPSKYSPQKVYEEITFTAKAVGFHMAQYEYSLIRLKKINLFPDHLFFIKDGEKKVVQEVTESNTWNWFPEEMGLYVIGVVVVDEKEKASTHYPYVINKEEAQVSLSSSLKSPQESGKEIVFIAKALGLKDPVFEFRLSRLKTWSFGLTQLALTWETEQRVRDPSENNRWSWIPEEKGLYVLRVVASDAQEKAEAQMLFAIREDRRNTL